MMKTDVEIDVDFEQIVKKDEFGDQWPFTVDEVLLRRHKKVSQCTPVTVCVGGQTYGLNGAADMFMETLPLENIWKVVNPGPPRTYYTLEKVLELAFNPAYGRE